MSAQLLRVAALRPLEASASSSSPSAVRLPHASSSPRPLAAFVTPWPRPFLATMPIRTRAPATPLPLARLYSSFVSRPERLSAELARLPPPPARRTHSSSSSQQQQQQHTRPEVEDDGSPDKLPLTQRIKALTKKYGWWAVGVYTVLSFFDFGIAFALVQYLGMARVQRLEQSVKHWVKEKTGWSWGDEEIVQDLKDAAHEGKQAIKKKGYDSTFWAQFAIAYGIHKTLFLPFRIAATTAILPKFVKFLTKHGWAGRGAQGVKEKVKQVVKERKDLKP